MNIKKILEKGYFPKELPPPFYTELFANKHNFIQTKWEKLLEDEKGDKAGESKGQAKKRFKRDYAKYDSSQLLNFSIAKGVYSRRKLGIPNPLQFYQLTSEVVENWKTIRGTYKLSNYSQSTPIERNSQRAVRTKSKSWESFKFMLIEKSFNKKVELIIDISQFYPSIYTHIIPWAILGKKEAKRLYKISTTQQDTWNDLIINNDENAIKYKIANRIDKLVRDCNDKQSIGLSIGPDTSFILAEVIANRIDSEITKELKEINHSGVRYYDDYHFYFDNLSDAENSLKKIQQILFDFQLETNENKIKINKIPFNHSELWSDKFDRFEFKENDLIEIRNYFKIINETIVSDKSNSSWISKYALKRFKLGQVEVKKENWNVFLSFILQTLLIDSSCINIVFEIILIYEIYLDNKSKKKIKEILITIIKDHLALSHSYEVSWALWFFISFDIDCPKNIIELILNNEDSISKIMCLDIIEQEFYSGSKPKTDDLKQFIVNSSTFEKDWLLIYESDIKQWLSFDVDEIYQNEYFKIMKDYEVSFYRNENQIKPRVLMVLDMLGEYELVEQFSEEEYDPLDWY